MATSTPSRARRSATARPMPWFPPVTTADLGIDDTVERLRTRGAQLVGEVVQYKDAYRSSRTERLRGYRAFDTNRNVIVSWSSSKTSKPATVAPGRAAASARISSWFR
jgi:hypothetical protein